MSNLTQFAGGGGPVGSQIQMSDLGPTVTLADNSTWMRAGILTTAASAPQLAALPQYAVVSGVTSTLTAPTGSYNNSLTDKMASNGTGTIVSTIGYQNGIIRSTDYGATWSGLITGGGLVASYRFDDIIYAGGNFILIFNNGSSGGSQFGICYSATGAPSTWTTYYITNPTDWSGNSWSIGSYQGASLRWTGTYVVAALIYRQIDSGNKGVHIANLGTAGTSLASMTRPAAVLNATQNDSNFDYYATSCLLSSNNAGGLVVSTGYSKWAYSANHGSSWTFYTSPSGLSGSSNGGSVYLVGTKVFLTSAGYTNQYYVYDTPASTPTFVNLNINVSSFLFVTNAAGSTLAGSKIFSYNSNLQQMCELDTTTYTTIVTAKQLLGPVFSTTLSGNSYYCQYIDNKFVLINPELGVQRARSYTSSFSNTVYYGLVKQLGTNYNQYYVRVS
jgi:hypothetical protein